MCWTFHLRPLLPRDLYFVDEFEEQFPQESRLMPSMYQPESLRRAYHYDKWPDESYKPQTKVISVQPRSFRWSKSIRLAFQNANWNSLMFRLIREISFFVLDLILTQVIFVRRPMTEQLRHFVLPLRKKSSQESVKARFHEDWD